MKGIYDSVVSRFRSGLIKDEHAKDTSKWTACTYLSLITQYSLTFNWVLISFLHFSKHLLHHHDMQLISSNICFCW
jgi:hypothetical protein